MYRNPVCDAGDRPANEMDSYKRTYAAVLCLALSGATLALQRRGPEASASGSTEKTEFVFTRFRYSSYGETFARGWWATDYPKADRQFILGIKRLTRIHTRSQENVADATSDELFEWPWVYVEMAGGIWILSDQEAGRIRQYLLKGGFMMLDDIHGIYQTEAVLSGVRKIFPDRPLEELPSDDSIFHVLYDLDERLQVPGTRFLTRGGGTYYPRDATVPRWLGVRDDHGRLVLTVCVNSDVGDAWEWADLPEYPEDRASFAYRLGINYIVYGMTH